MNLTIKLEGNRYNVYDKEEGFVVGYDRDLYGDEVAKRLAKTYIDGYERGLVDGGGY